MIKVSIAKHYQSLLILILLTLLSVFAVTGYIAINNIVSEQSRIQQQAISPVYSLVNRELLKPLHIAETFAETITFDRLLEGDVDEAHILEQLARMEQRLGLTFFVALENQRKQLMSNGRQFDLIEGKVYWYFQALKSDKRILADLGQVGDVHLFFDVRIYDDDGGFLGFVGVGKRIRSFVDTFATYKKQYGYDFLFVNENNQVILTSLPDLIVTGEFIPELNALPWFDGDDVDLQNLDSQIVTVNGEDVLISEIDIQQLNWRLLLLSPLEQRQAKLTETFAVNAGLVSSVIIILITALFIAFVAYKRNLEKRVEIDALTGLANRSYLQRRYQRRKHSAQTVSLVIVDLDHFKQINDKFGHNAGDAVLREVAHRLQTLVRAGDTVCRWGGEEFVLLMHDIPKHTCLALVEKIRTALQAQPVPVDGQDIALTASFGVSVGSPSEPMSKHLANADVALYESKKTGRNRVTLYRED
ncbi:sensor domain-containing diguanylate cyclase [Alteromonas sp. CYL-A6]|uniref:sensor domain-containing diguanylate cyclase n=1 Tax=Alteromonas nitratireducens TaxID=3390813 RepID=UPI0034AC6FF2